MKLLNLASNNSFWRGIDYHHENRIIGWKELAEGRRVICKHMIALDLGIFPEKEQQMMDYIEEQNQLYEQEYEKEMQEREEEIREYVMKLSKAELRQLLIQRMIDDLYD